MGFFQLVYLRLEHAVLFCSMGEWPSISQLRSMVASTNGTAAKFVWNLRSVMTRVDRGKNFFVIAPR